jgi:hypothetical protein
LDRYACQEPGHSGKHQAQAPELVTEPAGRPAKDEVIEEIEAVLERSRVSGPSAASIVADLDAERR